MHSELLFSDRVLALLKGPKRSFVVLVLVVDVESSSKNVVQMEQKMFGNKDSLCHE